MAEGMISLASGVHWCPNFCYSLPHQRLSVVNTLCVCVCVRLCVCVRVCVYIYTYIWLCTDYINYRRYQITLQWNICTQIGAVRSVDWIFIVGGSSMRWLDQYVTLGRAFCRLLLKQKVTAAQLLPHSVTYRIPGGGLNLLAPNVNYSWRTAPLTSKVAFYIFIKQT